MGLRVLCWMCLKSLMGLIWMRFWMGFCYAVQSITCMKLTLFPVPKLKFSICRIHKITTKLPKQVFQKLGPKKGSKSWKKLNLKFCPISMTQKDSTKWTTSKNFPKKIEFFNKRILNSRNQIPIFLTFPFSDWNSVIQMKLKFIFLCLMDKRQNERRRKGKFSTCPSTAEQEHNTFSLILSN